MRKTVHHPRQRALVEPARVGQQTSAGFPDKADAFGNACKLRHQCRFEGIRQHVSPLVASADQTACQTPAFDQRQLSMGERAVDGVVHLRHAPEDGQRPTGCEDIDASERILLLQAGEQRLGQQCVAYP